MNEIIVIVAGRISISDEMEKREKNDVEQNSCKLMLTVLVQFPKVCLQSNLIFTYSYSSEDKKMHF